MVNFLMKAMIKRQLKGVPDAEIDKILTIVEKNPDFFKKMGDDIKQKTKSGMGQQEAMQAFMSAHKDELQTILGGMEK
jgi:hypothetical protein